MLNIQQEIQRVGLKSVVDKFNLRCNRHKQYPNLVELCYHQTKTPINKITNECRGIILDESNNYNIVSYPFNRFFNYDDVKSKEFNYNKFIVTEKIDGSLIHMYYYDNKWNIATKGLPDASGIILDSGDISYNDYFWSIWHKLNYIFPNNTSDTQNTFIFEFKFPNHEFLTTTKTQTITLIGVRNNITYNEYLPYVYYNWDIVQTYDNYSFDDLILKSYELNPMINEGFVCVDNNFNRIKVKSPQYTAIQLLKQSESKDNIPRILDIIKYNGENSHLAIDLLNHYKFNHITSEYDKYFKLYKKLIDLLDSVLSITRDKTNSYEHIKQYDEIIQSYVYKYIKGEVLSSYNYVRQLNNKKLLALLNKL